MYEEGIKVIEKVSPAVESDVKRLLEHFCQVSSLMLIVDKDKEIDNDKVEAYETALKKRVQGLPVQYITNEQVFMGLTFYVDNRVLIPRSETELLVTEVLELLVNRNNKKVMDIGIGSGAICLSIAKLAGVNDVYGIDVSMDALTVAMKNAKALKVEDQLTFIQSDLFQSVPESLLGQIDIMVSNPPYIPPEEMAELHEDVKKEPSLALYGGADGLDFYRKITADGLAYLKENGILLYEVGHNQGEAVTEILYTHGFDKVTFIRDYQGFKRVVIGYKL